jgi:cytochrome c oxidase subunit 3
VTQTLTVETQAPHHQPAHDRPPMLAVGIMIWLGSELMFFSGLFAAYFTIRANAKNGWPPHGTHLDTLQALIFTVILVASSPTMQMAVWREEKGNRKAAKVWVAVTLVLGTLFVGNQGYEWIHATTRWSTNAYGSLFYIMTGLHGLHVFLGLVAMIFLLGRMKGPAGDPGELAAFQGVSYYWHFVDIVWIGLFFCLFYLK